MRSDACVNPRVVLKLDARIFKHWPTNFQDDSREVSKLLYVLVLGALEVSEAILELNYNNYSALQGMR